MKLPQIKREYAFWDTVNFSKFATKVTLEFFIRTNQANR